MKIMHIFVNSGEYSMLASITVDRYASAKLTGPNKFSNMFITADTGGGGRIRKIFSQRILKCIDFIEIIYVHRYLIVRVFFK